MRLKSVYISQYKNLKEFTLNFDSNSFIDVFVGKNGTGKSNLFEAIIEIFRHLHKYDDKKVKFSFNFHIKYEIDGRDIEISWILGKLNINGRESTTISQNLLPENVLIYYSGHNHTVTELVEKYKQTFRKKIKKADFNESRYFIGIGSEYKELLLLVLLIQKDDNKARQFICQKLDIKTVVPEVKLVLKRPAFADKKLVIDSFDSNTHYWGAIGITRKFLDKLVACIKGEFKHGDIYDLKTDSYSIVVNIELFQNKFQEETANIFRQFDNLKTLNMLVEISMPLTLENGTDASISHFSDGQFQSVYIYSILELFKDCNCITLLDEPDSFLHPEWQSNFLKQIFDIADTTSKNNHVLMSSHSASTIMTANDSIINLFEFDGNNVIVNRINKADIIKSLSAGIISFSESEARLNINHVLKNITGSVLFTEGITDEMILETAWDKLYQREIRKFDIQQAFSCSFLRNLIKDENLYRRHPGRVFFSIFDFDEAYKDWNQMGQDIQTDPDKCLVKQDKVHQSFALLLPVPNNQIIRKQVINPHSGRTYGNKSLLTIELLFYGINGLERYFTVDNERTDGFIKFISDGQKVTFAEDIVPNLDPNHFEVFRPIFEFIRSKCPS